MLGITQNWRCWCSSLVVGSVLIAFLQEHVFAQITPDSTLPNNSSVVRNGNAFNITGGTQAGSNLFHSFNEFSVPTGGAAIFNNALDIQNIISRVTGKSVSNIDGLIRSEGTANLFLINPNGIIFGRNASLDVKGSFAATTANALQFGNQGFFSTTNPNTPELLTVSPSAFFFNQIAAAPIQNNSIAPARKDPAGFNAFGLRVPDGKSLMLVGGNVSMDEGRLNAFGGRVELGGLTEPGTVALGVDGDNLSLKFIENIARADVSLINSSGVFVTGAGGGNIAVNASNLEILAGTILSAGIVQGLGTLETIAGDITLNATREIKVAGASIVRNLVRLGSQGNGGNITIDSGSFSLRDRAQLQASTYGQGNPGNVTVRASYAVYLAGSATIFSTVEAGGVGKGGNIDINAATLSLTNGAQLQTATRGTLNTQPAGRGDAGNINIKVTGAVDIAGGKNGLLSGISSFVAGGTQGNGGNITIDSGSFLLRDGARLSASTYGQGNAGNVTVRVKDAVSLADADIFSTVEAGGVGGGGNIDINAATLSLADGAQLTASTSGQGNAGNVTVRAKEAIFLAGSASIFSTVRAGGVGKGGNIGINAATLSLADSAQLSASTSGQGNAGNVTVQAKDSVSLADANIFSTVESGAVGNGGDINISAASLSLVDSAQLITQVRKANSNLPAGRGEAGSVNIDVTGAVTISGVKDGDPSAIFSSLGTGAIGKGSNITISSGSFSLTDGAQLAASTLGQGQAGSVNVRAIDSISLADANIFSTVESGAVGNGGDININAASIFLQNGSQLQTLVRPASYNLPAGRGDAGNVNIDVTGALTITGVNNEIPSGIRSQVRTGAIGNGGNITIFSGSFSLTDGAVLTASTYPYAEGNAGAIQINAADSVSISGTSSTIGISSALFTFTNSLGRGGDIIINTSTFSVSDGAVLNAQTTNDGNGGNIIVSANRVEILNGGQLLTTTSGRGGAGKITVNAGDSVIVNGSDATFDARFAQFPENVPNIGAESGLFVRSEGAGIAGDIEVTSPQILLDNSGRFIAESASGNGGNIILGVRDLLLQRRRSLISTNAGTAQRGGNGGNINIIAPSGFIVAVPNENSDITANAYTGNGGRVQINSSGIYGTQFREKENSLTSDITASSNFGTQGTVELNTPEVDPNSGLLELPTIPVDTQVAQGCYSPSYAQSSFVINGRGGLPPNPKDILTPEAPQKNWVSIKPSNNNRSLAPVTNKLTTSTPKRIVEATGAMLNESGQIVFSANSSTVSSHTSRQNPIQCHGS